jgi:hypothetical protein
MKLQEAIEALKKRSELIKGWNKEWNIENEFAEAIDTVVAELEKPLPCDCVIGFEGDIPVTHKLCVNCKSKI